MDDTVEKLYNLSTRVKTFLEGHRKILQEAEGKETVQTVKTYYSHMINDVEAVLKDLNDAPRRNLEPLLTRLLHGGENLPHQGDTPIYEKVKSQLRRINSYKYEYLQIILDGERAAEDAERYLRL